MMWIVSDFKKIELHVHLDCSVSYAAVSKLAPGTTLAEYHEHYRAPARCPDLAYWLERPPRVVALLQSASALRLVVDDLFAQLVRDGVVYAEIRFAPLLHVYGGLAPREVVDIVASAVRARSAATGIEARIVLCTLRQFAPEQSLLTAWLACEFADRGVVGLDLAGDETKHDLDAHEAAFAFARSRGVGITAHAGEVGGSRNISETLDRLRPTRIGHGIRSIDDPALVDRLVAEKIHLEVCPSHNVQTSAVDDYASHPIDRLLRTGVPVGINTDARAITSVTLTHEYDRLRTTFGWDDAVLRSCNLAALDAAFAPAGVKERLREQLAAAA
jgi:adenosine deaminase